MRVYLIMLHFNLDILQDPRKQRGSSGRQLIPTQSKRATTKPEDAAKGRGDLEIAIIQIHVVTAGLLRPEKPYRIEGPPRPPPIPCSRLASCGYFSCTSSCVRVASAYESALTISPSVLESSAARSKYRRASVTFPCCRRSWAIVATAMSHSGSTVTSQYGTST